MWYITLDIETCPLPEHLLGHEAMERLERETTRRSAEDPSLDALAARRKAASLHPLLGYVCCISAAAAKPGQTSLHMRSWTAASPEEEKEMLVDFWEAMGGVQGKVLWITFNGKRFDVPFLVLRTRVHGLSPSRTDLLDTYPYNDRPHCDLLRSCASFAFRLEELCALLGVPSPKQHLNGNGVAEAMACGDVEAVQSYCEADVRATYEAYCRLNGLVEVALTAPLIGDEY